MIKIYNRTNKTYEEEQVAGKKYIKWCYESPLGKGFTELLIKRKFLSKLYGIYCDTKLSKNKINSFIENFNIDISEFKRQVSEYKSFNDFFYRSLKSNARPIDLSTNTLISPGDGRLSAFNNISMNNLVQIKNLTYSLSELIQDDKIACEFEGGTCLVLRLCPVDYHRFHFVDFGIPDKTHKIPGNYYSVNPMALEKIPKLFCQNKREWSVFHSENFDDILYVEVGATCVGTIIQSYTDNESVIKGSEKGYFKYGGSTTVLFFKKDVVKIDSDIIEQTKKGYECKVILGEIIGKKK